MLSSSSETPVTKALQTTVYSLPPFLPPFLPIPLSFFLARSRERNGAFAHIRSFVRLFHRFSLPSVFPLCFFYRQQDRARRVEDYMRRKRVNQWNQGGNPEHREEGRFRLRDLSTRSKNAEGQLAQLEKDMEQEIKRHKDHLSQLETDMEQQTIEFNISKAGSLIGTRGSILRQLHESSCAKIKLNTKIKPATATITGTSQQVKVKLPTFHFRLHPSVQLCPFFVFHGLIPHLPLFWWVQAAAGTIYVILNPS